MIDDANASDVLRRLERELLQLRRSLEPDREGLPGQAFQALEVRVGEGYYAVPIDAVQEILQMLWCDAVADAPEWVLGTFRYGREVVPMIDLQQRLEGRSSGLEPSMSVVLTSSPALVGFAVQEVRGLVAVEPAAVVPPSPGIPQAPFLVGSLPGSEERVVRLLSSRRLSREYALDDDRPAAD